MPDETVQTPAPAPAQNPQVVQSGASGFNWKKVILVVVVILGVTAIIVGAYWYFILGNKTSDNEFTGPVPKPTVNKTATPSATNSATPSAVTATPSAR